MTEPELVVLASDCRRIAKASGLTIIVNQLTPELIRPIVQQLEELGWTITVSK